MAAFWSQEQNLPAFFTITSVIMTLQIKTNQKHLEIIIFLNRFVVKHKQDVIAVGNKFLSAIS